MKDSPTTVEGPSLDERRVKIEETKLELDLEKNKIERLKAWSGSASTFASLVVVAGTISLGIWSQYEQSKLQHELQVNSARAQFELKAAELVMATDSPRVTRNKARALQSLFPQYLSDNFASSFVAEEFASEQDGSPAVPLTANGDAKNSADPARSGSRTLALLRSPAAAVSSGSSAFTFKGGSRIAYQHQVPRKPDNYGGNTRPPPYMPNPNAKKATPTPTPEPEPTPER